MRKMSLLVLLAVLCTASLYAQGTGPTRSSRDGIDNSQVHVYEVTAQPHQPSAPQEHPMNRVFVFRDAGQMTWTVAGKVQKLDFKAGDVRWDPAGPAYVSENVTDHPIQLVVVDLKNTPANPPLVLTNLDMLVSDPDHYKLVFENDQVRVLRVRYGPHEKGGLHQHARGRVIVNLSDNLRQKYGDVGWHEPETHQEMNDSDAPVDRLVVEAK